MSTGTPFDTRTSKKPGGRLLRGAGLACAAVAAVALFGSSDGRAQIGGEARPFEPGEVLEYRVSTSRFGDVGSARMAVEGPVDVRGRSAVVLSLAIRGRVAFFSFADTTVSWLAEESMTALRYRKAERHPLSTRSEMVEIFPDEGSWTNAEGEEGLLMTDQPLDELSFLYFARTLSLPPGDSVSLDRHFDPERNPVRFSARGREVVTVPAGSFEARTLVMTVRDDERFGEEERGRIRIDLSTGPERLPLRIVSSQPWLGEVTMSLVSSGAAPDAAGRGLGTIPMQLHTLDPGGTDR